MGRFNQKKHEKHHGPLHPFCGAAADETVIEKQEESGFYARNATLHTHLEDTGKDTLLITGIYADLCVRKTIRDGILSGRYNILGLMDCIDHYGTRAGYAAGIAAACHQKSPVLPPHMTSYRSHFSAVTSHRVFQALPAPAETAVSKHCQLEHLEL